jgi:hypothetical protein
MTNSVERRIHRFEVFAPSPRRHTEGLEGFRRSGGFSGFRSFDGFRRLQPNRQQRKE